MMKQKAKSKMSRTSAIVSVLKNTDPLEWRDRDGIATRADALYVKNGGASKMVDTKTYTNALVLAAEIGLQKGRVATKPTNGATAPSKVPTGPTRVVREKETTTEYFD